MLSPLVLTLLGALWRSNTSPRPGVNVHTDRLYEKGVLAAHPKLSPLLHSSANLHFTKNLSSPPTPQTSPLFARNPLSVHQRYTRTDQQRGTCTEMGCVPSLLSTRYSMYCCATAPQGVSSLSNTHTQHWTNTNAVLLWRGGGSWG